MVDIVGKGTFSLPEIILWSDTVAQSYKGKTGFWPITFQADKILEIKPLFRDYFGGGESIGAILVSQKCHICLFSDPQKQVPPNLHKMKFS